MHLVDVSLYYSPENGVVKTYLSAKAKWLSAFGRLKHSIVVPRAKEEAYGFGVLGVPSVPVPFSRNLRMPGSTKNVASILTRLQPDFIEVGDPFQFAWAALEVKKRSKVPVAAFCHFDLSCSVGRRFGKLAERSMMKYLANLYRHFDLVLAPRADLVQKLREAGIGRARHQPLGVDTSLFNSVWRDHKLRTRLALPPNARLLVHACRRPNGKGLSTFKQAVEKLGPPYHALIVGADNLPSSKQVSYISLPQNARALATLLASCDVMIQPGQPDGFGSLVKEAMACGLPVVGEASEELAELVHGKTGVLVGPGNADELAQGVQHVYRNGVAELGRNARRMMVQQHDWNHILPQLMAQYVSLIAGSGPKPKSISTESIYVSHQ